MEKSGKFVAGFHIVVKVLLVDDQKPVRLGLKRILNQEHNITVIGECEDGDQVLELVTGLQPDVIFMDVRMKRMDGIKSTKLVQTLEKPPPVSMLTTFGDEDILWNALAAGAAGFVLKDAPPEDLIRATHVIAAGGAWLDPKITGMVIDHYRSRQPPSKVNNSNIESLTTRELEVLVLVADGLLNREIANRLSVSEATVKTHISHIFSKLNTRDRAATIVHAYNHGIVTPRQ